MTIAQRRRRLFVEAAACGEAVASKCIGTKPAGTAAAGAGSQPAEQAPPRDPVLHRASLPHGSVPDERSSRRAYVSVDR